MIDIILTKTTFWTNNVPLERRLKMTSNVKWHVSCLEFHFGGRCSRKIAHAIKRGLGCVSKIYANQEVKRSKSAKESKYKLNCLLQQKAIFVGFQFLIINYLLLFSIFIFFLSFVLSNQRFVFYSFLECDGINKINTSLHKNTTWYQILLSIF